MSLHPDGACENIRLPRNNYFGDPQLAPEEAPEEAPRDASEAELSAVRLSLKHGRELGNLLPHDFPRLKFDGRAGRNDEGTPRFVGIAPNPGSRQTHLQNAKVTQFDILPLREGLYHKVQGLLDDILNPGLRQTGLAADADNQISFGEGGHVCV